jgi:hypothetical protein
MAGFTMPASADPPATQAGATVAHQALELRLPPVTHDQALARIAAAGSEAPLFWSPLIDGEALRLELTLPAGADPKRVRLALPAVSHVARLPSEPPAEAAGTTEATDPACHADWDHQSRATTLLLYNHPEGATGACTGTLVADDDPATDIPCVLTAQHCFPDQRRASSVESPWLLRAQTCVRAVVAGESAPGGADVHYLNQSNDTALPRLRRSPPADAAFVEVEPVLPAIGNTTVGIHHPLGGPQELRRGTVGQYKTCLEVAWCGEDADPTEIGYVRVERRAGGTNPGSSGSGLFDTQGLLVGTHLGGSDEGGSITTGGSMHRTGMGFGSGLVMGLRDRCRYRVDRA